MIVTREILANNILFYLKHEMTLAQLVDWAEKSIMDADYEEKYFEVIDSIIVSIGAADAQGFEHSYSDYELYLKKLGYNLQLSLAPAA